MIPELDDLPYPFDAQNDVNEVLFEKLADAQLPGYKAEFAPDEAELAGAFVEDALSEEDAFDSCIDLIEAMTFDINEED
ncbi:MAG: conjugal transfer protein TraD [Vibrionaceae bacterium]